MEIDEYRTMEIGESSDVDLESAARTLAVHSEERRARQPLPYTGRRRDWDRLRHQCYESLVAADETGARRVLERLRLARVPLLDQVEELLAPALQRVGDACAAGTVSRASCRIAAGIGERTLSWAVSRLDDPAPSAPLALVITPSGDDHRLPALMAGAVLRDGGWAARRIDGVAVGEVVELIRRVRPALAVVSFALSDLTETVAEIRAALEESTGVAVLVGGPGRRLRALHEQASPLI